MTDGAGTLAYVVGFDEQIATRIRFTTVARKHAADTANACKSDTAKTPEMRAFWEKSYLAYVERYDAELAALIVFLEQRQECREKIRAAYSELFGRPMPDDCPTPPVYLP